MKKVIVLFGALLISAVSFAQGAATSTAIIRLRADDWMDAKTYIDQAYDELQEARAEGRVVKVKVEAKFWYNRALIYQRISVSNDPQFAEYKSDALGVAAEALEELFKVDEKNTYTTEGKELYAYIVNGYLNRAFDQIDTEQFLAAKNDFVRAYELKKNPIIGDTDTTSLYNASLMAQYGEDYPEAIRLTRELIEMDYLGAQSYVVLSLLYKKMDDPDGAIAAVREGREKYPSDRDLLIEEVNYFIGKGDDQKATETLNLAVQADPNNALLWNALGTIQLKLGDETSAMEALNKAVQLDDSLAEAQYSIGVIWVEKANDMVEKLNAPKVTDSEYKKLKAEQTGYFEKALPFFERALVLMPEDPLTLDALKVVYYKLDMTEKSMEMKKRLDEL
jgi:tetratricopeptide (TPR) repeat protein